MNRKIKVFISLFLVLTTIFTSATALSFTFDQIVKIISAAKIDGQQLFSDGVEINFDRKSIDGILLLWLISDQDSGALILPKRNSNEGYMWREVDKQNLKFCMDFLVPSLSDYLDYKGGDTITFQVSTQTIPSEDLVVMSYSPYLKNPDNKTTFSDADLFCNEVKKWANALVE